MILLVQLTISVSNGKLYQDLIVIIAVASLFPRSEGRESKAWYVLAPPECQGSLIPSAHKWEAAACRCTPCVQTAYILRRIKLCIELHASMSIGAYTLRFKHEYSSGMTEILSR